MQSVGFSLADYLGIVWFIAAWIAYYLMVEQTVSSQRSLNRLMHQHRYAWMRRHLARDNRIIDANINASLQNGTAFFASTSLLALGGSLSLLRSSQEMQVLFSELPLGVVTTRLGWELKALGLVVIFAYAFFKFSWSYRLFNYGAILIGAVPERTEADDETRLLAAWRAASMNTIAGRHFNRGQRAFFFALGYLGWFIGPYVLMAATACVLYVMWHRQFASDALGALSRGPWPDPP